MIKSKLLTYGFLGISSLGAFLSISLSPVSAQCVQSHVGMNFNMSRNPANQSSDIQFDNQGSCVGNVSSSTSVNTNVGGRGSVSQHQSVRHQTRGGSSNPSGVNGPTVSNGVVVNVDVRTPKGFLE
jgi:hypothetical protein